LTSDRPTPTRHRLATAARVSASACIFAAGLLLAGALTSSAPAAPEDCLPVVGCVTTTVPIVSVTVTVPTLPATTTLPTLPGTTTTTAGGSTTTSSTGTATDSSTTALPTTTNAGTIVSEGAVAFKPKATVRVRGRGAKRVVEIRVNLTKAARLNALLSRKRGAIVKRLFTAKAGPHLFTLQIGRAAKPGLASLSLVYRAVTGEAVRRTHRLRLPR
jgi:hypothetical protein